MMFGKGFWKRVNFQQLGELLMQGSELPKIENGTAEERYKRLNTAFYDALYSFRDKTIAYDWDNCDETKKEMMTEEFWEDAIDAGGNLLELSFEMGLQAGLLLSQELSTFKDSTMKQFVE